MAYVQVPKDLAKVRSKLIFNLTPRQLICFGSAAIIGVPVYFLTRGALGSSLATMLLVALTLPFFFLAMYEKDNKVTTSPLNALLHAERLQCPDCRAPRESRRQQIVPE